MLCTEVHKRREKVRGRECVDRCKKELYIQRAVVCGCYESELFACDQGRIHYADSVEKCFLNGSKRNETGINIPEFVQ